MNLSNQFEGEHPTSHDFDVCDAYWLFYSHWHVDGLTLRCVATGRSISGQLHRMKYRPAPALSEETLTEESRDIYDALVYRWHPLHHRCRKDQRSIAHDARGIPIGYTCHLCHADKIAKYRPDVMTDPNYQTDDNIEPEPGCIDADEWQENTMPGDYDRDVY